MRLLLATLVGVLAFAGVQAGELSAASCAATPAQTEGPYYKPGAPFRRVLVQAGMPGTRLVITGRVLDQGCRPLRNAVLDFWQADARGAYDNNGFRLRGRQRSDAQGRYRLGTVLPGLYSGRTRHIHVKVTRPGGATLTTQLYFPSAANAGDSIFDRRLLVKNLRRQPGRWTATFAFVVG